jgi:hypothetical protein
MKIFELIDKLSMFDLNAEVVLQDPEEIMTLHEIETFGYVPSNAGKTLSINARYWIEKTTIMRSEK